MNFLKLVKDQKIKKEYGVTVLLLFLMLQYLYYKDKKQKQIIFLQERKIKSSAKNFHF